MTLTSPTNITQATAQPSSQQSPNSKLDNNTANFNTVHSDINTTIITKDSMKGNLLDHQNVHSSCCGKGACLLF
ncbi:UNKNOWN [Stylonychia lemnae]|uniref:Uncharacterized protein n=1 Tax=Stylonychia lemnae TaxID=5949 RepID=A0A078AHI6_STYLE|nr:UNKNOWN [Stylonychia lemnae]|eukprot:CDW81316.1 UNKNOWN [Stylonychia lemnae]